MPVPEVVLVPGENIAIWPEIKLGRAYVHIMEFQSRVEEWESLGPLRTKAVQISPHEMWITLDVVVPPPLELLASVMGDAIHNLRSALDAAAWEMAHFDGAAPTTEDAEKAIHFPLYLDPSKFVRWVDRVGSLAEVFVARLEAEQPYHRAAAQSAAGQQDTLSILHDLDIVDKHRNSLAVQSSVKHLEGLSHQVRGDATRIQMEARTQVPLVAGAVLVVATSSEEFELIASESGEVSAHFELLTTHGFAPILELLGTVAGKVRFTLDRLYGRGQESVGWDSASELNVNNGEAEQRRLFPPHMLD